MSATVLRIIGTSATLTAELQAQAQADLEFPVSFEVLDGVSCQRRGVMAPESYDIYDQWFHSLDLLWTAGSIQPIDTARIRRWPEVEPAGDPMAALRGHGTRPGAVMFARADRSLGPTPDDPARPRIAMLPTIYNVDSFAYLPELDGLRRPDEEESWAWLLDDRWHGRCAIGLDPAASAVELALGARAAGLMAVTDPGDLTIEEIDELFAILMSRRRSGHFGRFWASNEEAVRVMAAPGCLIGSLWSPAHYALRGMGHEMIYATPAEGYRGWHAGQSISAAVEGEKLEMAHAYLNWWLDGVPGAIMARQGYYTSVTGPLRETLSPAEWAYWYAGEPAPEDLSGPGPGPVVRRGERRPGGSFRERMARVAVWSTIMPEHNYLARRWREFTGP
ncbi:MAG: hypothetical protein IT542_07295 [Rubellimicrobium sp.]|nr:hypothetical protein [Rubellimicrobium sp.]